MKLRNLAHAIIGLFLLMITIISCGTDANSEVMLKLFNIKTTNPLYLNLPSPLNQQCLINKVTQNNSQSYAEGIKVIDETGEKLTVVVDFPKTITLNNSSKKNTRFVIPFAVDGSETGNLRYIGLFELDLPSNNVTHKDSYFLGDGIIVKDLEYDGFDKLKLAIQNRKSEQPNEIEISHFMINEMINPIKDNN